MKAVNPYLNFDGNAEEAFEFYRSIFGGEFLGVVRFRHFANDEMRVPEADLDRIAHIALPLGPNNTLMGTDVLESFGHKLSRGNNFAVQLETDSAAEATRVFDGLAEGGTVEMALQSTEWAEKYGSCADRFGVRWMVNYTGDVQFVAPN